MQEKLSQPSVQWHPTEPIVAAALRAAEPLQAAAAHGRPHVGRYNYTMVEDFFSPLSGVYPMDKVGESDDIRDKLYSRSQNGRAQHKEKVRL